MNMVNTIYNSTEDMINKLQEIKEKTKLKFRKNLSEYYYYDIIIIIRFDEEPFAKNAQSISKIYHEVLLLLKFLQTKPQMQIMKIKYYDLYYTVIKNGNEKDNEEEQYENYYNNFNGFITPTLYIGINNDNVTLR